MFLIYNFHLAQENLSEKRDSYLRKIEDILPLNQETQYQISVYGLEAFYFASLKSTGQIVKAGHLFEGWKKMNRFWSVFSQVPCKEVQSQEHSLIYEIKRFAIEGRFLKIASNLDKLLIFFEQNNCFSEISLSEIQNYFPFLIHLLKASKSGSRFAIDLSF